MIDRRWPLTLREEFRLSVFKSRVLRKIYGPTRDDITGTRRIVHNEKLYGVCSSPNNIWVIK